MRPLRKATVLFKDVVAGVVEETEQGYRFTYDSAFRSKGKAIAVAFPIQEQPYESPKLFPFFRGLLPEGWYREVVCQTLKIDPKDDFGLLIQSCGDAIGAVSIRK